MLTEEQTNRLLSLGVTTIPPNVRSSKIILVCPICNKELREIIARTKAKYEKTSVMDDAEILSFKAPCPLLKKGSCSSYAFRPMACRIYLSTKLETCLEFYRHPENESNYPALIDFPMRAGQMINEGFCTALKEMGVETTEFRLEEGLHILFQNL